MIDFYSYTQDIRRSGSLRRVDWYDTTNDIFRFIYSLLGLLVRDNWQELIFSRRQVRRRKGDTVERVFNERVCEDGEGKRKPNCTTFREAMTLIFEHDERVREHFQLVKETAASVTYHVIQELAVTE